MANRLFMGLMGTGMGSVTLVMSIILAVTALRDPSMPMVPALLGAMFMGSIGAVFFLLGIGVLAGTLPDASDDSNPGEMSFNFDSPISVGFDEPPGHITVTKPGLPLVLRRRQVITATEARSAALEYKRHGSGDETYLEQLVVVRLWTGDRYVMSFGDDESRAQQTAGRFVNFAKSRRGFSRARLG